MTSGEPGESPWADPATTTQAGAPYGGPPTTGPYGPPPYGWPAYGPPPSGPTGVPYGQPAPWSVARPPGPRRPGQVTAAAVLMFVQAGLVLFATLYLWVVVSFGRLATQTPDGPVGVGPLVAEGTALAVVQVASVAVLVLAGALALIRRSRLAWVVLLVACIVQVVLAGYWATRLPSLLNDLPGGNPDSGFIVLTVVFAAGPLVALGLVLFGPGRTWFDGTRSR